MVFQAFQHQKNWWLLIGVAIVVAVIASLITAGITGNVIKLNQDRWGKNLVYTKAEVDWTLKSCESNNYLIGTNQINNLMVGDSKLDTCEEICNSLGKFCFLGFISEEDKNTEKHYLYVGINCRDSRANFGEFKGKDATCICCGGKMN